MSVSTESFIEHCVNQAEISALKWALKYWDNPNGKEMIEQYISELTDQEVNYTDDGLLDVAGEV